MQQALSIVVAPVVHMFERLLLHVVAFRPHGWIHIRSRSVTLGPVENFL